MDTPDSSRSQPASTGTADPHDPGQLSPTSLDPQLTWPRPFVDQPARGPRTGPTRRMPRFSPRQDPASPHYDPAADATAPPLPQRPHARPALPAGPAGAPPAALPPGRHGAPAAPPAGRAPVPPPPAVSWGHRPEPVRAVIGDEMRIPFIWCEFGTCDATYTHPDALGERDLRDRALAAGWRYDALGRRGCPSCAQHDPTFWPARPPAPVPVDWRRAG